MWSPQWVVDMHRPELWGYLQFARAEATPLRADTDWPAKAALMDVYYAQRAFHAATQRYAKKIAELSRFAPPGRTLRKSIEITATHDGYTATMRSLGAGTAVKRWKVRQDSRLWPE